MKIIAFSRILGYEHDGRIDPGQVGCEGVDSRSANGADVGSRVGGGVAVQIPSELGRSPKRASDTYYKRKCSK